MTLIHLTVLFVVIVEVISLESSTIIALEKSPERQKGNSLEKFFQEKDSLLNMLEAKLKEATEKKKKKQNGFSKHADKLGNNGCESLSNAEVKLKANGISAVGEVNLILKNGNLGKGALRLDAEGISNVGKAYLDLNVDDGNIHIPGLSNVFSGRLCQQEHDLKPRSQTEEKNQTSNASNAINARRDLGNDSLPDQLIRTNEIVNGKSDTNATVVPLGTGNVSNTAVRSASNDAGTLVGSGAGLTASASNAAASVPGAVALSAVVPAAVISPVPTGVPAGVPIAIPVSVAAVPLAISTPAAGN